MKPLPRRTRAERVVVKEEEEPDQEDLPLPDEREVKEKEIKKECKKEKKEETRDTKEKKEQKETKPPEPLHKQEESLEKV